MNFFKFPTILWEASGATFMIIIGQDIAGIGLRAASLRVWIKRSECSEAHGGFQELQEIVKASSKAAELAKI